MPRFPRPFTLLVLLACGPTLTGCQGWRTVDMPWPQAVASAPGKKARLTLVSGAHIVGDSLTSAADSLVVWGASSSLADLAGRRVNIAGRDVTSVAIRGTDAGKTALMVVGVAAVAALLIAGGIAYNEAWDSALLMNQVPHFPE